MTYLYNKNNYNSELLQISTTFLIVQQYKYKTEIKNQVNLYNQNRQKKKKEGNNYTALFCHFAVKI